MSKQTIEEGFAYNAERAKKGEDPKWRKHLIVVGLIDVDKTTRFKNICMVPEDQLDAKALRAKTEWLRPYDSDPIVRDVIKQMDSILDTWELQNTSPEALANPLKLYGQYQESGHHVGVSLEEFDAKLEK